MTSMSEALSRLSQRMPRVVREHEVLRIAGWLPGADPDAVARQAAAEVLKWAQHQAGVRLPPAAWEGETFDLPLPGRDPSAIRLRSDASDVWAFRMNRPDGTVPGRAWTNEVVLGHLPGKPPQFSVRQLVATDEPELSVAPAVPRFVREVAGKCGFMVGRQQAAIIPMECSTLNEAAALIDHLLDPGRVLPTFVFTTTDGVSRGSVDPSVLNSGVLGLAHVAVAHADACWFLTDQLGKRLSVFGGAARIYLPGFSEDANPYTHRLVLANQLERGEDVERVMRWMRQLAAGESIRRTRCSVPAFGGLDRA